MTRGQRCLTSLKGPKTCLMRWSGRRNWEVRFFHLERRYTMTHYCNSCHCVLIPNFTEPEGSAWSSPYPHHPTSWTSILILSSHLCLSLPNSLFPSGFPTRTLYTLIISPIHATCPVHLILLKFITRTAYLNVKQCWLWCITLNIAVFGPEERGGNNREVEEIVYWRAPRYGLFNIYCSCDQIKKKEMYSWWGM